MALKPYRRKHVSSLLITELRPSAEAVRYTCWRDDRETATAAELNHLVLALAGEALMDFDVHRLLE